MKKLVLACCAVLAVGCCMMVGGWAAGGQLYGSYYNGMLHPVTESLHDISDFLSGRLHYHTWWSDDDWHSGWFADDFSDRVEDVVNQKVDAALDRLDTDWSQAETGTLPPFSLPKASLDNIRELELTCKSGTGSRFTIESGIDYGLEGDFSIVTNEFDHEKWELEITCNGDEVTLILPESVSNYDDIEITSRLDASIDIAIPLRASKSTYMQKAARSTPTCYPPANWICRSATVCCTLIWTAMRKTTTSKPKATTAPPPSTTRS